MKAYTKDNVIYLVHCNCIDVYEKQDNLDLKLLLHFHLSRNGVKPYEKVCTKKDVIEFVDVFRERGELNED